MIRAVVRTGLPPTGVITCSCRARRIFACIASGMSPISSRNSVPFSASRNAPERSLVAPVNEPFTWPNSSLSSRSAGMAAQLTAMNELFLRRL